MNIEIKNFGPISDFSFDLEKDLHVIYGTNSIGKSYAIYCVYLLLKRLSERQSEQEFFARNDFEDLENPRTKALVSKIKTKISKTEEDKNSDIQLELENAIVAYFNFTKTKEISDSFENTFASLDDLKNRYSNKKPELVISESSYVMHFNFNARNKIQLKSIVLNDKYAVQRKRGNGNSTNWEYTMLVNDKKRLATTEIGFFCRLITISVYNDEIVRNIQGKINNIYILPASRSGLYLALSSFSPIIAELSKYRFQLKNKIELPAISEPIADYFIPLTNLNGRKLNRRLSKIVEKIEKEILHGKVKVDNERKRILFQPSNTDLNLDLSVTSSMISEIAPIVTYLNHIVDEGDHFDGRFYYKKPSEQNLKGNKSVLFIEEPEAHLHPEAQMKLMELFVELVRLNVKVVITSHSNYMFNKLVNLVLSKKIDSRRVSVSHMKMTKKGSVIVEDMQPTKEGIDDSNFAEVSLELYEERMKILKSSN